MPMNERNLQIPDLPPRARALNPDELSNVYGGCSPIGGLCNVECDCCGYNPGYRPAINCAAAAGYVYRCKNLSA